MQPQLNGSNHTEFTFRLTKLEQGLSRVFGPQRARDKIVDRLISGSLRATALEFVRIAYPRLDNVDWGGLRNTYGEVVVYSTFWRGSHANGALPCFDGSFPTIGEWDASVFETRAVVHGRDLPSDISPPEQVAGFDEAEMVFIERATGIMCHADDASELLTLFDVSTATYIGRQVRHPSCHSRQPDVAPIATQEARRMVSSPVGRPRGSSPTLVPDAAAVQECLAIRESEPTILPTTAIKKVIRDGLYTGPKVEDATLVKRLLPLVQAAFAGGEVNEEG